MNVQKRKTNKDADYVAEMCSFSPGRDVFITIVSRWMPGNSKFVAKLFPLRGWTPI